MPVIETLEKLDDHELLSDYQSTHGKPLKPICRRKNSVVKVPEHFCCPRCSAPSSSMLIMAIKDNTSVKCVIVVLISKIVFLKKRSANVFTA